MWKHDDILKEALLEAVTIKDAPPQLNLQIPKWVVIRMRILDVPMLRLEKFVMLNAPFLPSSHESLDKC